MKELVPSFCVGVTQMIIGHPFDTVKILMQNRIKWFGLPICVYYKGFQYPLMSGIIYNCTIFPVFENSYKSTHNVLLSGFIAGFFVSPIVYVLELLKIKKQTNKSLTLSSFKHGIVANLCRESLGTTTYFSCYDCAKHMGVNSFISGGIAGLMNWTLSYPFDVIRSRQIANGISFINAFKIGYLWNGYSVCAGRAIIVNSVNFSVYESIKQIL